MIDEKVLQSLARLNRNNDFKVFLEEYVGNLLEVQIDGCINAPNPQAFQGAAQVLKKLLDDVEAAEAAYRKRTQGDVPLQAPGNPF